MSETRTFHTTDEAACITRCELVSDIAGPCAAKLMRVTVPAYLGHRSTISLSIDLDDTDADGRQYKYQSDPITVTGWELETKPFFLSEPILDIQGAVFVMCQGGRAELINEDFYEKFLIGLPVEVVFPIDRLYKLHAELTKILTYRS